LQINSKFESRNSKPVRIKNAGFEFGHYSYPLGMP
jgi:hypothetical protein